MGDFSALLEPYLEFHALIVLETCSFIVWFLIFIDESDRATSLEVVVRSGSPMNPYVEELLLEVVPRTITFVRFWNGRWQVRRFHSLHTEGLTDLLHSVWLNDDHIRLPSPVVLLFCSSPTSYGCLHNFLVSVSVCLQQFYWHIL